MAFSKQQTRRAQAAVIVVLLVLVVVLAAVVLSGALAPTGTASATAGSPASATADAQAGTGAGTDTGDTAAAGTEQAPSMDDVNATYGTAQRDLETAYNSDPQNPSALLNLANGYYDWGVAASQAAKSSADTDHVHDLFDHAIKLYDQYLAANPHSNAVIVDRAACYFYRGDHAKAIKELEDFTASNADYAPAWANLGLFFENDGQTDKAREAYQRALDKASDESVKSFAQQHLAHLDGSDSTSTK